MKMIIKNCPAIYGISLDGCKKDHYEDGTVLCQDCTNCLLKQIVELCRETCRKRCTNDCLGTKKHCGYGQILELLDIQEVE